METAFSALSEEKFLNNGSMLASSLLSAKSDSKEMTLISILLSDRMCAFDGEISCILPTSDAAIARFPSIHSSNSFIHSPLHWETIPATSRTVVQNSTN